MAEINIKIKEIDNAIQSLKSLQKECNGFKTTPPSTVGGGKTVSELEELANVYKNINNDFSLLLSNTISFLQNVKNSYVSSDQKAANKILK